MTSLPAASDVLPIPRERDQVLARIGAGGMAEVFLIRRTGPGGFEKFLALKRVRADLDHETYGPMFLQEARLVASLHHPNIVQVHDAGADQSGHWFLMEYVHGKSVNALIRRALERHVEIPVACAMFLIACVGRALHYAHHAESSTSERLAVIHRDVSPGNILVSFDGIVKLADFGIARGNHRHVDTQDGTFKGKFGYAAPEHCRGEPLDSASDIFSLGIVLHEIIAARNLFRGESPSQIVHAVMASPIPSLSGLRADVPPELDALVQRMLERDRSARIASGAEVANQLDAIAHQYGLEATRESLAELMRSLFSAQETRLPTAETAEPSEPRTPSALAAGSRQPLPQRVSGSAPPEVHGAATLHLREPVSGAPVVDVVTPAPPAPLSVAQRRWPFYLALAAAVVAGALALVLALRPARGPSVPSTSGISPAPAPAPAGAVASEPAHSAAPLAPAADAPATAAPAAAAAPAKNDVAAVDPVPAAKLAPDKSAGTARPAGKPASKRRPRVRASASEKDLLERDW